MISYFFFFPLLLFYFYFCSSADTYLDGCGLVGVSFHCNLFQNESALVIGMGCDDGERYLI